VTNLQETSLPPQAQATYKLLLANGGLTAARIGRQLDIFPNAVYRSLETLQKLGCVTRKDTYPAVFQPVSPSEAVERFLLLSREGFLSTFGNDELAMAEKLRVNFLKDRYTLLKRYATQIRTAEKEINLIISGHELPAEVYFENLKAVKRGVKIRIIVQQFNRANRDIIKSWQECGIEVRYLSAINVRLVLIDRKIVHMLSYDEKEGLSGLGVEVAYAPFAEMLAGVFESNWQKAKNLRDNFV